MYIYQLKNWPNFTWQLEKIVKPMAEVRHRQGRLIGRLEGLGFKHREETNLETLIIDITKTSEIEGENLPVNQVRSSIARRLGVEVAGLIASERQVDGIVELMLDATQNYDQYLTEERLFQWHTSLFPGKNKISVGEWRKDKRGPMRVVSGAIGKERIHFEAPEASTLNDEMKKFLHWFNTVNDIDPVLKAAIAHLWFVTNHPFEDGNGRIARAITDLQLARSDKSKQRFYSMSAQIQKQRNSYYEILENTQKSDLDITPWVEWFLSCLEGSLNVAEEKVNGALYKAEFWGRIASIVLNERQQMMINKILDGFDGNLTTSKWAKISKCSADTALRDIQYLIDRQILEKEPGGGRSSSYRLSGVNY